MNVIAELRQKMGTASTAVNAILEKARAEKRALNTEEQTAFDKGAEEITALQRTIQAEERAAGWDASLKDSLRKIADEEKKPVDQIKEEREQRASAFRTWLHQGDAIAPEIRALLTPSTEFRAQVVGTNNVGGYTVPQGFWSDVIGAMKDFTGVVDANPRFIDTDEGRALPIPMSDDTANIATLIAENTAATDLDVPFDQVTMNAYKYTTRLVKISAELLQDSGVDIEGYITSRFGERLGRGWNAAWTTGTGSSQPQGVVTGSVLGKTAAAVAAVTSNEILDLIHSVDPAYRPGARLMFHDSTLKAILQLADSQNRPLFQPSYRDAAPATIHGYPFSINQSMATMASTAKFMLFGNFQNFWIRRVKNLAVRRLVERYAESDVIAFVGFARMDSKLINAGQNPIKHMVNAT